MADNIFRLKLTMISDFHIGTGTGIPGGTDKLVSKDTDGFPQIPAKTLVGIWRDALERLCEGLGGDWSKWVEVIFGNQPNVEKNPNKTPVPATLSLSPARISANLRAKIGNDSRLKQALTFIKVGVKIDEESGTSSSDMLRFEEMGRSGTVFEAEAELDWSYFDDEQKGIARSLLVLSVKFVERIGGKRRRGAGKCELLFFRDNYELLIAEAKNKISEYKEKTPKLPEKTKNENIKTVTNQDEENRRSHSDWQTCEYSLELETPVSIVTAVLGNVSETLDYIPGTYLISHFVKHLGQEIFAAIQANNFQISPATICIDGKRSFPIPKVFAQEKMARTNAAGKEVYNRLYETLKGKAQTKPIREGFFVEEKDGKILHSTTPLSILMHNAVDDKVQRPTSDVVGVYSREAIKAGTILKGEISYRGLDVEFKELNGKVRIGTSKKDDYGLAKIEFGIPQAFKARSASKQNELIVYFASDVMLRNSNLRQTNSAKDLAEALGLKEENITFQQIQVRRIESWQVNWGFPRPTLTLMQAGSVVRFKTNKEVDVVKLEAEGIGERRGEGYGKIIFNPEILADKSNGFESLKPHDFKERNIEYEKPEKSDEDLQIANDNLKKEIDDNFRKDLQQNKTLEVFAKLLEKTAWREELKIAVSKIADNQIKREKIFGFSGLNMSQIGGLRSAVMRLKSRSDVNLITNWINHLERTPNRKDKWKDERIKKVRDILSDNRVWTELKIDFNQPKSLDLDHDLQNELWAEAVKSLFYACQHAYKRELEKEVKTNG